MTWTTVVEINTEKEEGSPGGPYGYFAIGWMPYGHDGADGPPLNDPDVFCCATDCAVGDNLQEISIRVSLADAVDELIHPGTRGGYDFDKIEDKDRPGLMSVRDHLRQLADLIDSALNA